METRLVRVDRNGSKHYEGMVECPRCGGAGLIFTGVVNGIPVLSSLDNGVCWKCGGSGKVLDKWVERTPEYQAKLDARREAKWEKVRAEREAKERAEQEAREAKEAELKAQKAISQFVGNIGDRLDLTATYVNYGSWEQSSYNGYGTVTMFIHIFKDANGNVLTWKTQSPTGLEAGDVVNLRGTVKAHNEYQGEKQTVLTRCKY